MYIHLQGGEESYEVYLGISDDRIYHGIWLGLSNPEDEINLYHRYSGDVSSCVVLRHSATDKTDAMIMFTLNNDYRLYYGRYSNLKEFVGQTNKQIAPTSMTIWEGRTYPIILQNIGSVDTIFITLVEQIDEAKEDKLMNMAVWSSSYNTASKNYVFDGTFDNIIPSFTDLPYKRSSGLVINSLLLKTYHNISTISTISFLNWIEPNIVIGFRRLSTNYTSGVVIAIPNANRINQLLILNSDGNLYIYATVLGKETETNEIYIQAYRSTSTLDTLFSANNTAIAMTQLGSRMMGGIHLTEDFPTTNGYIDNKYGVVLTGLFNYYSGGMLVVIGYNVYLLDKTFTKPKLILKLQRWDHWETASSNARDKVYIIRGREHTLVIPYDPDKVYNTETIAPYNIPFLLYKHDAYIGDDIAVDNSRLRFVSSSKGVYYDNTNVNDMQYAVIVHGNIKSPDMDSIYRTIDDLYKRIGELESKI